MLKRLRKTIQDAANSPTRGSTNNPEAVENSNPAVDDEASGFICPMCMSGFGTPDELQVHFDNVHIDKDNENAVPKKSRQKEDQSEEVVQHNVLNAGTLHANNHVSTGSHLETHVSSCSNSATLQDGDENAEGVISNFGEINVPTAMRESEKETLQQQLEVMEAQIEISIKTNEDLAREKDEIAQKLAKKSQECAHMRALCDEIEGQKQAQIEINKNQITELEKAAAWISNLESQLIERPGADDVLVLKKELVSVQTLMDQLTLDSENKKEKVENKCRDLKRESEELQEKYGSLKLDHEKLLAKSTESDLLLREAIQKKEFERSDLMQNHTEKLELLQIELKNSAEALLKQREYSTLILSENNTLKKELTDARQHSDEIESNLVKVSDEMSKKEIKRFDLERKIDDLECSKKVLHDRLQDAQQKYEKTQQKSNDTELEKNVRIESLTRECGDISNELTDARNELSSVKSQKNLIQDNHEKLQEVFRKLEMEAVMTLQRHESEIAEVQSLLCQANAKNVEFEKQIDELTAESKLAKEQIQSDRSSTHIKIMEKKKLIMQMKVSTDNLEEELDQCKKQLQDTSSKLEVEISMTEELKNKVQSLNSQETINMNKLNILEQSLTDVNVNLSIAVKEKVAAQEEVSRLQQERNDLHQKIEVDEGNAAFVAQLIEENEALRNRLEESGDHFNEQMKQYQNSVKEYQNAEAGYITNSQRQEGIIAMLNASINKLKVTVDQLHENGIESRNDLLEKKQMIIQLKEEYSEQKLNLEGEISYLRGSIDEKTRECEKLSASMESIKTLHKAAWQEAEQSKENFQKRFDQLQEENLTGQMQIRELEQCIEEKNNALAEEKTAQESNKKKHHEEFAAKKFQHEEKVALLESSLRSSKEELMATNSKLEISLNDNFKLNSQLRDRINEVELLEAEFSQKDTMINSLREKIEDYKLRLNKSSQILEEKEKEWAKQKIDLEQKNSEVLLILKSNHAAETERIIAAKKEADEKSVSEIDFLRKQTQQANHIAKSESSNRAQLEKDLAENKTTLVNLQKSFELTKESLLSQIGQKSRDHQRLETIVSNLRADNEILSKEIAAKDELCQSNFCMIEKLRKDLQETEEKLKESLNELDKMTSDLQQSQDKCSNIFVQLTVTQEMAENAKTELEKMKKITDDTKSSLDSSTEIINSLNIRVKDLDAELLETQKTFQEKEEEAKALLVDMCEKEKLWSQTEHILKSKMQEMKLENEEYEKKLEDSSENHLKEKESWTLTEKEFHQKQLEWSNEKEEFLQSVETLKAAQQILMNGKMDLQKQLEESQENIEKVNKKLNELHEFYNEEKAKNLNQLESVKKELAIALKNHDKTKLENQKLEARLQLEISTLRDNLDSVRGEWQLATQQVEMMNNENDELKGKVVVLQATVQNNADEKRTLFERCIRAEQSVEQMKAVEVQIKRRLDDAQAAMHELGRENQAMQVKHTSVLSRQWADDRDVLECLSCQRQFSITIRKHHCRHCGLIFCADCSSKTMQLAASKKPARVCEKCYDDLLVVQ